MGLTDTAGSDAVLVYLRAVVAASERLVAETDLKRGVDAALAVLRQHTGLDRIYLFRDQPDAAGFTLFSDVSGPGVLSLREMLGARTLQDEDFPQVAAPLRAGEIYQSIHREREGENQALNAASSTRSDLIVPVFAGGRLWGAVGFDDCRSEHTWSAAEIAALQGVAAAISAAVLRETAMAERQRDNARHEGLLRAASEASARLASEADLEAGLQGALDALRLHSGADRVFLNRYLEVERATYFWLESRHSELLPFVAGFGPGPWPDEAFGYVTGPLLQGRVYRSLATQRVGENARRNEVTGSLSELIVPIMVDGRYKACLGFDDNHSARLWTDADVAVLQTVAAAIASAMQRDASARAGEQERQRYESLLRAVAEASNHLLAAPDFRAGLDLAMAALGGHAGHSRAYTWELSSDEVTCTLVAEWDAPGIPNITKTVGTANLAVADYAEVWTPLLAGSTYQSITPAKTGANAGLNEAVGVRSDAMVPIFVSGRCWGCIGFDNCHEERTYSSAEIDVLTSAANAVAAAISRHRADDARVLAERLRADDTVQVNRLLEGVVTASRALLDDHDFEGAMQGWLAYLATAVDADRAMYGDYTPAPADGAVAAVQLDWTRPGLRCMQHDDIPASSDFLAWTERLARGETIWAHRDELVDPVSVRYWESADCWTNLIVPVVVDRQTVGWLCFDFETRREWKPALGSVLRTAADAAAAAIKRRHAVAAMLAERDGRIALEQQALSAERARADALRQANDALIDSMSRLVALQDLPAFMGQLLLSLTRTCGARTGALLAFDGVDGRLWMRHGVIDGELVDVRTDPRLELWRQAVPAVAVDEWRRQLAGQVLAIGPVPPTVDGDVWPQIVQWHWGMGHRLRLHFPLNIGGQLVGIAALMMKTDDSLDDFAQQQAVVLAQQAAIAMQMERLARLVESSAVRTERERMAAEIHDNLAQSFTSIAMQSESLAGLLAGDPEKSRVLRLIERTAREGLAEARMSVLALLPADGWPGSLDQSLAGLAERSSIRGGIGCRFESKGIPCAMPGPVQETLLRIAQEATSNAMRHSGGTQVVIHLEYAQQRLRLTIEDDGRGLPSADGRRQNGGFGVVGMEARAVAIGGTLSMRASALGGLAVTADVPCKGAANVGGTAT